MSELTLKSKYEIKELQLNALLEITQAINSNLPEDSLYKIYNFTLRSNLNIEKLALFVLDEEWELKVNFGTKKKFNRTHLLPAFKTIQDITHLKEFEEECDLTVFDIIVPVAHKGNTLALVFVGGLDKNGTSDLHNDNIKFIQALSNIIIVAIENKKLARRQLEQE